MPTASPTIGTSEPGGEPSGRFGRCSWFRLEKLRHTLYWRLGVVFFLASLGFGSLCSYILYQAMGHSIGVSRQILRWHVASLYAATLEEKINAGVSDGSLQLFMFRELERQPEMDAYLLDSEGRVAIDFGTRGGTPAKVSLDPIRAFLAKSSNTTLPLLGDDPKNKAKRIFAVAPLQAYGRTYYLYLLLSNQVESVKFQSLMDGIASIGGVLTILGMWICAALMGLSVYYLLTMRLRRLIEAVTRYKAGDFSQRLEVAGKGELALLADAVNTMADSIETSVAALEHRDKLRRELIGDVAHDLRGPLALICNWTERFKSDKAEPLTRSAREYTGAVEKNSAMLGKLLAELFELAQLEAKEIKPHPVPVELEALFEDLSVRYRSRSQAEQITVVIAAEENLPFVYCDATMIERVFTNLIDNAFRYTPAGGTIELKGQRAGSRVLVSVSDSGEGISSDDLPRLFDRHYQPEGDQKKGLSGLGLTIVKNILLAHGTEIQVSSEEDVGTSFSFFLPICPASGEK